MYTLKRLSFGSRLSDDFATIAEALDVAAEESQEIPGNGWFSTAAACHEIWQGDDRILNQDEVWNRIRDRVY